MNEDYSHLLAGARLDYVRLGMALKAVIKARGCTLFDVQTETRVSRASVSRATAGIEISTGPLLLLCIWADFNPFELLQPLDPGPAQEDSGGDDGDYRVFHRLQGVKPAEITRDLETQSRGSKRSRLRQAKMARAHG